MRRPLRAFMAIGRMEIKSMFAFLPDVVLGVAFFAVVMFVFFQLWEATFNVTGKSFINGYSLRDMLWYLVATESIVITLHRVDRDISQEVKSGDIAVRLLRPLSYLGMHWASFLSRTLFRFGVGVVVGGGTTWLLVGPPPALSWTALLALPVLFLLTFSLNFCVAAMVGLSAFWVEEVSGVWLAVDKVKWMLGGLLIPLEVCPGWLQTLSRYLPFRSMLHGPARLFVRFSWDAAWDVMILQGAWLVGLLGLLGLLYRAAARRVAVNGG